MHTALGAARMQPCAAGMQPCAAKEQLFIAAVDAVAKEQLLVAAAAAVAATAAAAPPGRRTCGAAGSGVQGHVAGPMAAEPAAFCSCLGWTTIATPPCSARAAVGGRWSGVGASAIRCSGLGATAICRSGVGAAAHDLASRQPRGSMHTAFSMHVAWRSAVAAPAPPRHVMSCPHCRCMPRIPDSRGLPVASPFRATTMSPGRQPAASPGLSPILEQPTLCTHSCHSRLCAPWGPPSSRMQGPRLRETSSHTKRHACVGTTSERRHHVGGACFKTHGAASVDTSTHNPRASEQRTTAHNAGGASLKSRAACARITWEAQLSIDALPCTPLCTMHRPGSPRARLASSSRSGSGSSSRGTRSTNGTGGGSNAGRVADAPIQRPVGRENARVAASSRSGRVKTQDTGRSSDGRMGFELP
eukprot:365469-Chlamydomonas_euryale.AAC.15